MSPTEQHDTAESTTAAGRMPVVGIGASVGGLAALKVFFEALPAEARWLSWW